MAIPTVTYAITFSTDQDLSSGMLTNTDTTPWLASYGIAPADVEISWGFTGPDGVAYRVATFGMPGNIFPAVSTSSSVPLPTDIDGNILTGDYVVTVIARVGGAVDPGDYEPDPTTHELCADFPSWDFDEDVNCLAAWVTVTDNTEWEANGWTVDSRELRLQYPLSTVQHADITSVTATVSTAGEPIFRGQWKVFGEWEVTKDNLTVTITGYKTFDVFCSADSCKRWCQIECAWQAWQGVKDDRTLSGRAREKWETMLKLSMMLDRAEACGDRTLVPVLSAAYTEAAKNCGCNCTENTDLITPIYGSSGNAPLIIAGQGIVVAYGAGTVTISLTQAEMDFFANGYNTALSSPLGTVTIGAAVVTAGNPPLHTFPLEAAKPARDSIKWKVSWDVRSAVGTMTSPEIVGTTFSASLPGGITMTPFASSVNGEFWRIQNFIVSGTPQFIAFVKVANRTLTPAFLASFPYDKICEAVMADFPFTTNPTSFAFGLMQTCPFIGGSPGRCMPLSFYDTYLATIELEIEICKLG